MRHQPENATHIAITRGDPSKREYTLDSRELAARPPRNMEDWTAVDYLREFGALQKPDGTRFERRLKYPKDPPVIVRIEWVLDTICQAQRLPIENYVIK